ncbi:hypothetical protein GmHk_20G056990 [Glycine max]|nr:hypothetical protein GmHk_20G056990 [Glycine max]
MVTPLASLPPPPPPSPFPVASESPSTLKRTCKAIWLQSLATRPPGAKRPVVHIDPATGKANGPHKKKLRTYLGIVAHDKVDVTYETWKLNLISLKHLTALAADNDSVDDTVCKKYGISKEKWTQFCQTRRDPSWEFQSQIQSQGLALPSEPEVGPSTACVSTKKSCVDPSGNDPETGDLDKCRLYIKENLPCLVVLGRVYDGSATIHNIPLLHDQVKVDVEEVKDAAAPVPVPIDETLNTFLAWPTYLVKRLSEQLWDPQNLQIGQIMRSMIPYICLHSMLGGLLLRQKGSTECGYYVMHWISTIILGSFRNNWEMYFNDARPLEAKRLKAFRIQWAQYYLKLRNQTLDVTELCNFRLLSLLACFTFFTIVVSF